MAWSVDRLSRSLQALVSFLGEIHANRVDLYLHVQGVDTTTPAGRALFQMLGVFAEFERSIIQERIHAGLARDRSKGVRLGRPPAIARLAEARSSLLGQPPRRSPLAPSHVSWVSPNATCAVFSPGNESEERTDNAFVRLRCWPLTSSRQSRPGPHGAPRCGARFLPRRGPICETDQAAASGVIVRRRS
jgi:Resolvase, N terminal domain